MASSADRNLLFGILALQLNFVSREQLIAAVSAWVLEKQTALGQIFLDQKALGSEEHVLLEVLVEKHLDKHGKDPANSLAAVSSIESVRTELQRLADPQVDASLARVARDRPESDPDATLSLSVGAATSAGQRFRVLRPHAMGGLGEVFVAEDGELRREVALKQIQPRHADDLQSRSRFVQEAEITGGLEHPGIVPVYGLGSYADGRPFYAMRFIRGDSLKDAIEQFHSGELAPFAKSAEQVMPTALPIEPGPGEQSVQFRKLLGRFIDVCNAIEYAHSRGILHRDLKPGNIMLGKYGETLVVDWGLAKVIGRPESHRSSEERTLNPSGGSGSAPTQLGSAIGTPQYMSPEQAAGRHDQLGPPSDVYSLGATLYCLLTGISPFSDKPNRERADSHATESPRGFDVGEVLRRVQRGDFLPPRQLKADIPRPLEAICVKAMALKPKDRYPSPRELADDVEHWLADEPITALRDGLVARLARFGRRHHAWVRAGAATLAALTAASVVGVVLVNAARREAIVARELAVEMRDEADIQKHETKHALKEVTKTKFELEAALADSLLRPLAQSDEITQNEIEAFWELAASSENVRRLFVERALQRPETAQRLLRRGPFAFHAAVALDDRLRKKVEDLLLARMQNEGESLSVRLNCVLLGQMLGGTGDDFTSSSIAVIDRIIEGGKIDKTLDASAQAIRYLMPQLEPQLVPKIARRAIVAYGNSGSGELGDGGTLAYTVTGLASRLSPEDATELTELSLEMLQKQGSTGPESIEQWAHILAALSANCRSTLKAESFRELYNHLNTTRYPLNVHVRDAGVVLAACIETSEVALAARILVEKMTGTVNSIVPADFGKVLTALAPRMNPEEIGEAIRFSLDAMERTNIQTNDWDLLSYAFSIQVLASRLAPEDSVQFARRANMILLEVLRNDDDGNEALLKSITAIAPILNQEDATTTLDVLLKLFATSEKWGDTEPILALILRRTDADEGIALKVLQQLAVPGAGTSYPLFPDKMKQALVPLIKVISSHDASKILGVTLAALDEQAANKSPYKGYLNVPPDWLMAEIVDRLDAADAKKAFLAVLAVERKLSQSHILDGLKQAIPFRQLAANLPPETAHELAQTVVADLEATNFADVCLFLCEALGELADKVPSNEKNAILNDAVRIVATNLNHVEQPRSLSDMAASVATLASLISEQDANELAAQALRPVMAALGETEDRNSVFQVVPAAGVLSPWVSPEELKIIAFAMLTALENDNSSTDEEAIAKSLADVIDRLKLDDSKTASNLLKALVGVPRKRGYVYPTALKAKIAILLTRRLENADRFHAVESIMEWSPIRNEDHIASEVEKAMSMANGKDVQLRDEYTPFTSQAAIMEELIGGVPATAPPQASGAGGTAPGAESKPAQAPAKPISNQFSVQELIDLLKMPTCNPLTRQVIVRQLGRQCDQQFFDVWELVAWIKSNRPEIDLVTTPVYPDGFLK